MKQIILLLIIIISFGAFAESWFKIDIGDYKKYSQSDLQKRVWELERAVAQLQERVMDLEGSNRGGNNRRPLPPPPQPHPQPRPQPHYPEKSWICKVTAMGTTYTGVGTTKAIATQKALDSCKAGSPSNGFFCNHVSCEE